MMAPAMLKASDGGSNHPIGTGPFVFSSWEPNDSFKVNRNPHYWGGLDAKGNVLHGTPFLDSIEFRVITDDGARADGFQTGDVNMLSTISAQTANSLASNFTEVKDWDAGSVFVQLNTLPTVNGKTNPFANIHARQALAYATNARVVADIEGKGLVLATSPFGPNTPWGMPSNQNGYVNHDLAQAKAQVAEFDAETGASSLTFTLMGLSNLDAQRALQLLTAQWQEAGITAHIQTLGQTARITAVVTGGYEATYTNNYGYPDPDVEYYFWTGEGISSTPGGVSINFSHYTTPPMNKAMNTGRQSGYRGDSQAGIRRIGRAPQCCLHPHLALLHAVHLRCRQERSGPLHRARPRHHPVRELHAEDLVESDLALEVGARSARCWCVGSPQK